MVDPGPDMEDHVRALSAALGPARDIRVLLTHGHSDHAGAAPRLVEMTGASLQTLGEGDLISTDEGDLVALAVPGHSSDHLAFHWPDADALFVGDLLLGRGNTTWVGEYLGCVQDYLDSLQKVHDLGAATLYPAHGPPITSPEDMVERFRRHRLERLEEVRVARRVQPEATAGELARMIYGGEIPEKLKEAARAGVEAALYHLGRVEEKA